jgi:hypothetical protein
VGILGGNFQEINWRNPWEDYLGLITHFDKNLQNNGEKEKLVMQSFKNFNPNNINVSKLCQAFKLLQYVG